MLRFNAARKLKKQLTKDLCWKASTGERDERSNEEGNKVGIIQGGSNMTGTDLCVNKPHCAAAVRP